MKAESAVLFSGTKGVDRMCSKVGCGDEKEAVRSTGATWSCAGTHLEDMSPILALVIQPFVNDLHDFNKVSSAATISIR